MIHVCFGLHDKTGHYSKFTGTAMLSMFENHNPPTQRLPSITVHILHDNTLTPENRDKFIYLAGQYGQLVKFYNVEVLCADKIAEYVNLVPSVKDSRVSVGAFYRLLIPHILTADIKKVIYLDSDIVVNLDVNELWKVDLSGKILAAAPEIEIDSLGYPFIHEKYLVANNLVESADYFNSGVLIINLDDLRERKNLLMDGIRFIGEHRQCEYFDQDILNYLFAKSYVKLPEKFDVFVNCERQSPSRNPTTRNAIYHYIGSSLSLESFNDIFNRLWMSHFIKTPWFNEKTIGRLYAGVRQMNIGFKQSMVNLSSIMSGKTRAFFTPPTNIDELKKFFSIHDEEEIILAENQDSLNKLIDAMNASRGRKVFFIMMPNFPFQILIQAGFAPGRDFVNGMEFLSEAQGVPLNSYPLIQAM